MRGNVQIVYCELSRNDYQIGINFHTKLRDVFAKYAPIYRRINNIPINVTRF